MGVKLACEILGSVAVGVVMNKRSVLEKIIAELESQLALAKGASQEAADYATHEESKADSKWDTQGLEASYLAAGQAAQVLETAKIIQTFGNYLEEVEQRHSRVEVGAMFELKMAGLSNWFFLSASGGGVSIEQDETTVTVITPRSPIAHRVVGRSEGEVIELPNGNEAVLASLV